VTRQHGKDCLCRFHWPRRRIVVQLILTTSVLIATFFIHILLCWLLVAVISTWYTFKKTKHSYAVRAVSLKDYHAPHSEVFLAAKRYEQELVLCGVVAVLLIVGVCGLFLTPREPMVRTFIELLLPTLLVLAHMGVGFHSWMVNENHNIVAEMLLDEEAVRQRLAKQIEDRKKGLDR